MDGGNGWLDFTNKGVDKGSALRLLAAKEQFFLDEVLAFGDSENDMAMLKEAGLSYAMNTAKEHVKKCADRECSMVSRVLEDQLSVLPNLHPYEACPVPGLFQRWKWLLLLL